MTYIIGDRKINLEAMSPEDITLLLAHPDVLRFCINDASYQFLMSLKRIIHLYGDIITIYSTLLHKIPKYEDVTTYTTRTQIRVLTLEDTFNQLLGQYDNQRATVPQENWDTKSFNDKTCKICSLCIKLASEVFAQVISCLNMIEVFFTKFPNLQKLLISYVLVQSYTIQNTLTTASLFFIPVLKVDAVPQLLAECIQDIEIDGSAADASASVALRQLQKIESFTRMIEREAEVLNTAFNTFNHGLKQYTSILLGKQILKRDIDPEQCQLIKRRDVCIEAAEHVINIPLHTSLSIVGPELERYVKWATILLVAIVVVVIDRLAKVFNIRFWR